MSRQQVEGVCHGCRRHTERDGSTRLGHKHAYTVDGYISKEAWCGQHTVFTQAFPNKQDVQVWVHSAAAAPWLCALLSCYPCGCSINMYPSNTHQSCSCSLHTHTASEVKLMTTTALNTSCNCRGQKQLTSISGTTE